MNKKLLLLVFIFLIIVGCDFKTNRYLDDTIMVAYTDEGPFLFNRNLERYSLSKYDEIIPIFNDIITVGKNTKNGMRYGYISKTGKELIKPIYEQASQFSENKAVVTLNNKQFIINSENIVLYEFPKEIHSYSYYSHNKLVIQIDNQFTYLDQNYKISEHRFQYAGIYRNGFAVVGQIINNKMKYAYLDENDIIIGDFSYDFADDFYDGLARIGIYQNDELQYHYINQGEHSLINNDTVLTFEYAQNFSSGYAVTASYEINTGVKDSLPFKYKVYDIIDSSGKSISKNALKDISGLGIFSSFGNCFQNVFPIKGYIDINGICLVYYNNEFFEKVELSSPTHQQLPKEWDLLINFDYFKTISGFDKGYARVQLSNHKYGIVGTDGNYLVDPIYNYLFF